MLCLWFDGYKATAWWLQTNPLSYDGPQLHHVRQLLEVREDTFQEEDDDDGRDNVCCIPYQEFPLHELSVSFVVLEDLKTRKSKDKQNHFDSKAKINLQVGVTKW